MTNSDVHILPRLELGNGHTVSVQASHSHYCSPRSDQGPYNEVELRFPTFLLNDDIMQRAEEHYKPHDTVYSYVPLDLVIAMIKENGGIAPSDDNKIICSKIGLDYSELVHAGEE